MLAHTFSINPIYLSIFFFRFSVYSAPISSYPSLPYPPHTLSSRAVKKKKPRAYNLFNIFFLFAKSEISAPPTFPQKKHTHFSFPFHATTQFFFPRNPFFHFLVYIDSQTPIPHQDLFPKKGDFPQIRFATDILSSCLRKRK